MFSTEQRRTATETLVKFDCCYIGTIAELRYPNRHTLNNRWKEHERTDEMLAGKFGSDPRYTDKRERIAVEYYLEHGKGLARTMRALGYLKSREALGSWIDGLAPGRRKYRDPNPEKVPIPVERKVRVAADLEARTGSAVEIVERHGVSRTALYAWHRKAMSDDGGEAEERQPRGQGVRRSA